MPRKDLRASASSAQKLRLPGVIKTPSDWSVGVNNNFSSRAEFVYHHANHLATCKKVTWSRFLCIHRETCMRIVPCELIRRLISSGRARMKRFLPKTPKAFNPGEKIAIDRSTSDLGFQSFQYKTNHNIQHSQQHSHILSFFNSIGFWSSKYMYSRIFEIVILFWISCFFSYRNRQI